MSEPSIDPALAALEADLRQLTPQAKRLDRDALLFAAGQASARPGWLWPVATAVLGVAVVVLGSLLATRPEPHVERVKVPVKAASLPEPETEPLDIPLAPSPGPAARQRLLEQVFLRGLDGLPDAEPEGPSSLPPEKALFN